MKDTYEFLKNSVTYYLGTVKEDKPCIRPFGTIHLFENKLYIQAAASKEVSRQMKANPSVELCAYHDGKWIRVSATAVLDPRESAQKSLLDAYPGLRKLYRPGDGNLEVWYLKDATTVIDSYSDDPIIEEF